jgi:hypothetical protein
MNLLCFFFWHRWRIKGLEFMGRMPNWYVGGRTQRFVFVVELYVIYVVLDNASKERSTTKAFECKIRSCLGESSPF